jgi:hypothetical protein
MIEQKKTMFLPNSEEDEEPVGDGWPSLLIVTDTLKIFVFVTLYKKKKETRSIRK